MNGHAAATGARDFTSTDALEVLGRLDDLGVAHWLDGGWGIDALLMSQSRTHDDLDVVIDREDVSRAQAALAPLGFAHAPEVEPGLPSRVVLIDQDGRRQIDLHPVVFDSQGNGWQPLGKATWAVSRLRPERLWRGRGEASPVHHRPVAASAPPRLPLATTGLARHGGTRRAIRPVPAAEAGVNT